VWVRYRWVAQSLRLKGREGVLERPRVVVEDLAGVVRVQSVTIPVAASRRRWVRALIIGDATRGSWHGAVKVTAKVTACRFRRVPAESGPSPPESSSGGLSRTVRDSPELA